MHTDESVEAGGHETECILLDFFYHHLSPARIRVIPGRVLKNHSRICGGSMPALSRAQQIQGFISVKASLYGRLLIRASYTSTMAEVLADSGHGLTAILGITGNRPTFRVVQRLLVGHVQHFYWVPWRISAPASVWSDDFVLFGRQFVSFEKDLGRDGDLAYSLHHGCDLNVISVLSSPTKGIGERGRVQPHPTNIAFPIRPLRDAMAASVVQRSSLRADGLRL